MVAAAVVGFVTEMPFFSKLYSRDLEKYVVLRQATHIGTQLRA